MSTLRTPFDPAWTFHEPEYDPALEDVNASRFTLGNGYLGVRGSLEEIGPYSVQGLFAAGLFSYIKSPDWFRADNFFKKLFILDEDKMKSDRDETTIVNLPDFLFIRLVIEGEPFLPWQGKLLVWERSFDIRRGCLRRTVRWQDRAGRITRFEIERFVSMADPHLQGCSYSFTPENYSGSVRLESGIDGRSWTFGQELVFCDQARKRPGGMILVSSTRKPRYEIHQAAAHRLLIKGRPHAARWGFRQAGKKAYNTAELRVQRGVTYTLEKTSVLCTSRPQECRIEGRPVSFARHSQEILDRLDRASRAGYAAIFRQHEAAMDEVWARSDVEIKGDAAVQRAFRFNLYHLFIAGPRDEDISVGAKTLSGEWYRAFVFWDTEMYIMPFFCNANLDAARRILTYRYHRLDAARENARAKGYRGAYYPMTSAGSGREEMISWNIFGPIIHISAAVAFATWEYYKASGDFEFLRRHGLEMILECTRFYASRMEYNRQEDRYDLNCLAGPDEYHSRIDNNAYTNLMAQWTHRLAVDLSKEFRQDHPRDWTRVTRRVHLTPSEMRHWQKQFSKLHIPRDKKRGLVEQFEGYFRLSKTWKSHGSAYGGPGADYHHTQAIKQADTLLALAILPDWFDEKTKRRCFEYYDPLTVHGSSLSPCIHAMLGAQLGLGKKAYENFRWAVNLDLDDHMGNTRMGIHAAACGGVWLAAVKGFAGLQTRREGLELRPRLPRKWRSFAFQACWQGNAVRIEITPQEVRLKAAAGNRSPVPVRVGPRSCQVAPGAQVRL